MDLNEKGAGLIHAVILLFFSTVITLMIAKNLLHLGATYNRLSIESGKEVAKQQDVEKTTDIVVGDKVYIVTPEKSDESVEYDVVDTMQFKPDRIIANIDTKFDYVNYAILNGNEIVAYRLDPKTRFVGINLVDPEIHLKGQGAGQLEVKSANYPVEHELGPITKAWDYRLTFEKYGKSKIEELEDDEDGDEDEDNYELENEGKLTIKSPKSLVTNNVTADNREYTKFEIKLPENYTDIYIFKSSLTEPAPILLADSKSELLSGLDNLPYYHWVYADRDISFESNMVNATFQEQNEEEIPLEPGERDSEEDEVEYDDYGLGDDIEEEEDEEVVTKTRGSTLTYSTATAQVPYGTRIPAYVKIKRTGRREKHKTKNEVKLGGIHDEWSD